MTIYNIEDSPLWIDVKSIASSKKKDIKHSYRGMLHTEEVDLPVMQVISIDVVRDYLQNIGDYINIEFSMQLGDYINKLYPHRAHLEFSIKKILLEESSSNKEKGKSINIERYKAVFMADNNLDPTGSHLDIYDTESLNNSDTVNVKLQLLDRALEPLRIKTATGIYRKTTQKKLLNTIMAGESNKILVDGKKIIDGIDIVEPHNKKVIEHLVIPDGMLVKDIPSHLQSKHGGVYNGGVGNYLQRYNNRKIWFTYPLVSIDRFKKDNPKVIFYSIPENRLPQLDRTFNTEGSVTSIIVNSKSQYKDTGEADIMNEGSGFRSANASSYMKKPVILQGGNVKADRTKLCNEVVSKPRKDGLNYASIKPPTHNPFVEYSKVNLRDMGRIDLIWQNADVDLLYPGMPCKFIYLSDFKQQELVGTIGYVHAYISMQGKGIGNTIYRTNCQVTIFVKKSEHIPELSKEPSVGTF